MLAWSVAGVGLRDFDHLQPIQDTHCHAAGGLQAFASAVRATARGTDLQGFWGGNELVPMRTDTRLGGAREPQKASASR